MAVKKQHIFIHDKSEIVYGRTVNKNVLERSVEGYDEPCKSCNQYPSFEYNSKDPNHIKVITCEHVTVKPEKAVKVIS